MRVEITGHRGLGAEVERCVREMLDEAVSAFDAADLVGVSCIADGADAWFAETVAAAGSATARGSGSWSNCRSKPMRGA